MFDWLHHLIDAFGLPDSVVSGIAVAVASAWTITLTYFYEYGYMSYFGIPSGIRHIRYVDIAIAVISTICFFAIFYLWYLAFGALSMFFIGVFIFCIFPFPIIEQLSLIIVMIFSLYVGFVGHSPIYIGLFSILYTFYASFMTGALWAATKRKFPTIDDGKETLVLLWVNDDTSVAKPWSDGKLGDKIQLVDRDQLKRGVSVEKKKPKMGYWKEKEINIKPLITSILKKLKLLGEQ